VHGEVDFGPEAVVDMRPVRRAWYDRWLERHSIRFGSEAPFRTPVRMFVMAPATVTRRPAASFFTAAAGATRPTTRCRSHAEEVLPACRRRIDHRCADREGLVDHVRVRSEEPVPTVGGCVCCARQIMSDGPGNPVGGEHTWTWPKPIPLSARNDVVVFMTPPLERDTEIIGTVNVKLWASSSAVDTDFTAKLIDVYPSSKDFPAGFDLIMGDGIIRARYRESDKSEKMMTPGEIYEFPIKLDPCCNVFKKGHRIAWTSPAAIFLAST